MALPQITIGGELIGSALLSSVEVTQELNRHWWCEVICRQTEDQRMPMEQMLGKATEIKTTDQAGVEHVHFRGFVLGVRFTYEVWGSYTAYITCVSDSYKLDISAHKQYYLAKTLTDIAGVVSGRDGVPVHINASASKALNYVQYGETDYSFLNRIVDDYGGWIRPSESGGIEVYTSFQGGSKVSLRDADGSGLIDFTTAGNLAASSFSGSHYDFHAMQSNTYDKVAKPPQFYDGAQQLTGAVLKASQAILPAGFEPQRARAMTLDNYQEQLEAESERSMGAAVTASGHSRSQTLKAGDAVTVEGVLDAKGTYGLTRVAHVWTPQGYTNSFACTPWKNYRNPTAPQARTWNGIVPARVTAHDDPKKMGRIQVQFFWQGDGATHWARATSPHAGPDRGFMFMPEVGDEVAVAFEDGDPERPVILGSLWNGTHTQPRASFRGDDVATNDVKRIMTKSGNRIQMSDKPGYETVTMATPNSNVIKLTEKSDKTGRTTITIEARTGDILLLAPNGRVHIESKFYSKDIG